MNQASISEAGSQAAEPVVSTPGFRPLRIWPPIVIVVLLWASRIVPRLIEDAGMTGFLIKAFAPLVCTLLLSVWWLFASRARWWERLLGLAGVAAAALVAIYFADPSLRNVGMWMFFVLPWGVTAVAAAWVVLRTMRPSVRLVGAILAAIIGFGGWDAVRSDGVWGDFHATHHWRWEPTAEQRFLASQGSQPPVPSDAAAADQAEPLAPADWPGFRGANRDGAAPGVTLETDWAAHPPKQLWRMKVGPGWGSFSLAGKRLFTQEQRGDSEAVVCYDADTGRERWIQHYPSRFSEPLAGAGPRATPTLADGKLFTLGGSGILLCLDPVTGGILWQRDLKLDAGRRPPSWGFASSPLVTNGLAIVHAGGAGDKGVLAYDAQTGDPRWSVPAGDHSYSSPQLFDVDGRPLVLMLTNTGLTAIDPATAKIAWEHPWPSQGYRVLQPLQVAEGEWLLGTGMGEGTRSIQVTPQGETFGIEEQWTSPDMKPHFNDYVAHKGFLYGFDGPIFACIDLTDGQRQWKGGHYGSGQVLLLPDADQLLVLSETGEIVLLRATPDELDKLARRQVLEGRTWNHPILAGGRLYVRNGEEAACLEMPVARPDAAATAGPSS